MQEESLCPVESKLLKIANSPSTEADKIRALNSLQDIILNLLLSPNKEHKILRKDDPKLYANLLNVEGVTEYLLHIGYHEEDDAYVYITCDENMSLLDAASKAVDRRLKTLKSEKKPCCPFGLREYFRNKFCRPKGDQQTKLKDFLLKHRKEDFDSSPTIKFQERVNTVDKSEHQKGLPSNHYSFNPDGFFQQSCENRKFIKKSDVRKDLFERHELLLKKKDSSFLPLIKRKKH